MPHITYLQVSPRGQNMYFIHTNNLRWFKIRKGKKLHAYAMRCLGKKFEWQAITVMVLSNSLLSSKPATPPKTINMCLQSQKKAKSIRTLTTSPRYLSREPQTRRWHSKPCFNLISKPHFNQFRAPGNKAAKYRDNNAHAWIQRAYKTRRNFVKCIRNLIKLCIGPSY